MKYYSIKCEICNKPRPGNDHSICSRIKQRELKSHKPSPKKRPKTSEDFLTDYVNRYT